jgi:hypothetical protein
MLTLNGSPRSDCTYKEFLKPRPCYKNHKNQLTSWRFEILTPQFAFGSHTLYIPFASISIQ